MDELNVQRKKAFLLAPWMLETILAGEAAQRSEPKTQLGQILRFFWTRSTSTSPLQWPPISLLPAARERERGRGSKAGAHRFAIFRHDFSLLLLHKKRRILDYLWHSKPGESWSLTEYRKDFTASVVVQKPQSLSDLLFGWKYGLCLFSDVLQVRTYEGDSKLIEE